MLDVKMLACGGAVNMQTECKAALETGMESAVRSWIAWLATDPPEPEVTATLMRIQSTIRNAHDAITGRSMLGESAENCL